MPAEDARNHTGIFPATRWTYIGQIKAGPGKEAARAIEHLCKAYWYPLYVYARRYGLDETDAKDAVQDVFAKLLEHNRFAQADASRGKLRAFLLTILKNQIAKNREREHAEKRGGGRAPVELDLKDAEGRYVHEIASGDASPDRAYERKWAHELLRIALQKLRESYVREGKQALFETLSPGLLEGTRWSGHQQASLALDMTEGALRTALSRLRDRFRKALLAEVSTTVEDESEVKGEVAYLMGLFSR